MLLWDPVSDLIEERLRGAGLRATAPRVAVLGALSDSDDHPRVDQLIDRVRSGGVSISTQAAYDVCDALTSKALASRLDLRADPPDTTPGSETTTTTSRAGPAARWPTSTAPEATHPASSLPMVAVSPSTPPK